MEREIKRIEKKLENFVNSLRQLYADNLISVILYGSFSRGDFMPKRSDINLLIVLNRIERDDLCKAEKIFVKWEKTSRTIPILMTEEYIKNSLDVFPIEFSDMKAHYKLLYGKDILREINIEHANLRSACERELKTALLKLRQSYIRARQNPSTLQGIMINSFTSISTILRNLSKEFGLSKDIANTIFRLKKKELRLLLKQTKDLYFNWLKEVEALALKIDKFTS